MAWSRAPKVALAESSEVLVRMLHDGRNFRVRMRAAVALGRDGNPRHVRPLVRALRRDRHPGVRQAAIAALGELGHASGRIAVRRASEHDSSARVRRRARAMLRVWRPKAQVAQPTARPVPQMLPAEPDWKRAQHAVVVGEVSNRSGVFGGALVARAKRHLRARLSGRRGLVLMESGSATEAEAIERELPRFRIEANVTAVDRKIIDGQLRVRCEISLILMDEPGRSIRSILRGSATGVIKVGDEVGAELDRHERELVVTTLDRAIHSALRNAWEALRAAGPQMALLR